MKDRIRVRFRVKSAVLIEFVYWGRAKFWLMLRTRLGIRLDLSFHIPQLVGKGERE